MSKFADRLKAGGLPTEAEWVEYLIEYHTRLSGVTSGLFRDLKTDEGCTSYIWLADDLKCLTGHAAAVVLDLACGEGEMVVPLLARVGREGRVVGIDMSASEIEIARRMYQDPGIQFHHAYAHQLPLDSSSIDAVVCHMALMLMRPVEPVIKEMQRVLRPGGLLSCVVTSSQLGEGVWGEAARVAMGFVRERYPKIVEFQPGDSRILTRKGWSELFHPKSGFSENIEVLATDVGARVTSQRFWSIIEELYLVHWLPDEDKVQLREMIELIFLKQVEDDGRLRVRLPIIKFSVNKLK